MYFTTKKSWPKCCTGYKGWCVRLIIYTKIGDKGETKLQDGILIPKHHPIIQALAALDELNTHIGIIKSDIEDGDDLKEIQKNIMSLMSLVSTSSKIKTFEVDMESYFHDETKALEQKIDKLSTLMPSINSFVTYGVCTQSAGLDIARAIARRAETMLSQAAKASDYIKATFPYINRLSDYLYIKARHIDFENTITRAVHDILNNKEITKLNLEHAKKLLAIIENKASELNLSVVIACVDAAGNPIAVHVMDGSYLVSYEGAVAKAYTAVALKMPTIELNKLVQPGQPFYGLEVLNSGKILPIGGGIPLFDNSNNVIGAIGVSGGTSQQDHDLADIGRSIQNAR